MTRLPDIASLQLLVLVGEQGSLTAAAAGVGMTQPAASKRINALERRFGFRLLDRSRRGSVLTAEGTLVCGWAGRVLDELAVLTDGVQALQRQRTAQLTVAASLTVAEHLLPAWLGEFRRTSPELHIGLDVMNSRRVCEVVRRGTADLGFIESPGELDGLHSRTVAHDRLVLVVAPGHRFARRRHRPVGPQELAGTRLVHREPGSGTRDTAELAAAHHGVELVAPLLELGSSSAVRSAVLAGAGPALVSELVVGADLLSGDLIEIRTEDLELRRELRAVWRQAAHPTGPAADLLAHALRHSGRRRELRAEAPPESVP
ncbi:LysR family transcriptional regulator [Pseudonocardia parietis]|uniref:DNA-binding transcriptional LysR family regulator n=1 Tax=Pseudonocardia parietis TaxID=570936 RepID=A0ABS4VV67_9PSEU|nr:LysR family transcriptional regulator [Pseudonocardia parietis]MBP2367813.1 DNA-binding transcriptional LysR family regulator [Pseudonocardia parietis]